MKCKRDHDCRTLDHKTLESMRIRAVELSKAGASAEEIAKTFAVNVRAVYRWLATYLHGGPQALIAKPIPGRPMRITEEEMGWLIGTVRDSTPLQYKFPFALWTLKDPLNNSGVPGDTRMCRQNR